MSAFMTDIVVSDSFQAEKADIPSRTVTVSAIGMQPRFGTVCASLIHGNFFSGHSSFTQLRTICANEIESVVTRPILSQMIRMKFFFNLRPHGITASVNGRTDKAGE